MRKIKFRAWDKKDKVMREVTGINFTNKDLWLKYNEKQIMGANFFETELMQYTGLKDKNNKEIYEGDIVNYTDGEFTRRKGQIEFDCFGFMLSEILTSNREYPQIGFLGEIEEFEEFAFEVIGNIYENPELLKG